MGLGDTDMGSHEPKELGGSDVGGILLSTHSFLLGPPSTQSSTWRVVDAQSALIRQRNAVSGVWPRGTLGLPPGRLCSHTHALLMSF